MPVPGGVGPLNHVPRDATFERRHQLAATHGVHVGIQLPKHAISSDLDEADREELRPDFRPLHDWTLGGPCGRVHVVGRNHEHISESGVAPSGELEDYASAPPRYGAAVTALPSSSDTRDARWVGDDRYRLRIAGAARHEEDRDEWRYRTISPPG